jgi:hypothetical protein
MSSVEACCRSSLHIRFPCPSEKKAIVPSLLIRSMWGKEETREGEDSSIKATVTDARLPGETMVQTTSAFAACRRVSVGGERHALCDDGMPLHRSHHTFCTRTHFMNKKDAPLGVYGVVGLCGGISSFYIIEMYPNRPLLPTCLQHVGASHKR